uniref:Reverse transcriptase domain-containing protein n=1 Tax=Oryzias sinensis TaxID=183150 RepID=A0A8C7Z516_9TELE
MYANVKDAYASNPLPPLGRSDHNLVHLVPEYKPRAKREPPKKKKSVRAWTDEARERLRDCFQTTDWETLCSSHGDDIDSLTHCITDYISFCVENTVPTRRVRCFSNSKPWVTPELRALLKEKRRAFISGDREEQRRVQHELKYKIRQAKNSYKRKLEERLENNNVRVVWRGLKTISGHGQRADTVTSDEDQGLANELNLFFNRFDSSPPPSTSHISSPAAKPTPTPNHSHHYTPPPSTAVPSLPHTSTPLCLTSDQVRRELRRLKTRKAAGPDGIGPGLLRDCTDQLCEVVTYIFNLSLSLETVPVLWKTSCVVPVPKTAHAKELNHYRPVALTSHLMNTMERLILSHLRSVVSTATDPLQFAYRPNIGVDDAVIYLLHRALTHLEDAGTAVRVMFFDFSSAFNTIRPALLREKLEGAGVDRRLTAWTTDYLTNRPQYVRLHNCVSEVVVSSTGAPQGTVLSPFLFTLYTSDFTYNTGSCHLQKFSDDSAIVGCVSGGNELVYRSVIKDFVDWCERNHLCLNTSKTKEMVIDFRRRTPQFTPVSIQGSVIEVVDSFKYLGVHLNKKLDWTHNTDALYKKGQSRLHLLRRLRSFGVCRPLLRTFYDSVVASVIQYAVACWGAGSTDRDRKRLNKLVRRASSVLGCPLDFVEEVGERRMLAKLTSIMDNTSHPLHQTVEALSSSFSGRLLHPPCRKERFRKSFIPTAVRLYNATV